VQPSAWSAAAVSSSIGALGRPTSLAFAMRPRRSTMSPRSFSFGVTLMTSHSKQIVSSA